MAMAAEVDLDPSAEAGPDAPAHPLRRVAEVLAAIGTLWILALMLLVVADVVGRNFLDAPITGVAEFASRSVASIVFLTLGAAICAGRMTRSDFVPRLLGSHAPGLVKALDVGNALLGVLLFAGLAVIGWPELARSWQGDEYFGVQGVATMAAWPFRALLVGGAAVASLAYLLSVPGLLRDGPPSHVGSAHE
jgi:TRAP-type C4-dicarboxylate transport system permease small subunit